MSIFIREPGSSLTHLAALFFSIGAGFPLLLKASELGGIYVLVMLIFVSSMIFLYGASAFYHAVTLPPRIVEKFRKLDHSMIFVMIAGSYTPVCILVLPSNIGLPLLVAVWGLSLIGILIKILWINCPRWLSSTIYISLGWIVVLVMKPIHSALSHKAFFWLFMGGIIYTVGGVIYALKLKAFNAKHTFFNSHVIFHLFVMGGSFCHFIFMYQHLL